MCGIAGIVNLKNYDLVCKMNDALFHRGPDDEGYLITDQISLGMRRLSIIDPGPGGHQPISNENGSIWVVFNGEIYNHRQLSAELRSKGHEIKSNCDTETIVHLFEEYREDCVHHLRGMFAFAIWDSNTSTLFAARDRLGIKPFYFTQINDQLVFASELGAIIASGITHNTVDPIAIWHFLSLGAIPSPLTIWKDIRALLPGHRLTYCNRELKIEKYWDPEMAKHQLDLAHLTRDEAAKEVRRLLEEAVRTHLMSDVSLGAFLSGGIDSCAIVGLMSQASDQPIRTFSVGYNEGKNEFDERQYAKVAALHFGTEHQEVLVTGRDVLFELENIFWHMDQPTHDGLNTYMISKAAAATGIKVALSGLGGDEIFGGYSTFKFAAVLNDARWLTTALPSWFKKTATLLEQELPLRYRAQWPLRVSLGIAGTYDSFSKQYAALRFFYSDLDKKSLLAPEFLREINNSSQMATSLETLCETDDYPDDDNFFNRISFLELKNYMSDILLRDTDVMSMAHSLEIRVPLVDHKLVEFVTAIPTPLKANGINGTKRLLRESVKDLLPKDLLHRRKKGFGFPMSIWLRQPGFRELVEDCLSKRSINERGIFEWSAIERVKSEFYDRRQFGNASQLWLRVWIPTVLELWFRASENKQRFKTVKKAHA